MIDAFDVLLSLNQRAFIYQDVQAYMLSQDNIKV